MSVRMRIDAAQGFIDLIDENAKIWYFSHLMRGMVELFRSATFRTNNESARFTISTN